MFPSSFSNKSQFPTTEQPLLRTFPSVQDPSAFLSSASLGLLSVEDEKHHLASVRQGSKVAVSSPPRKQQLTSSAVSSRISDAAVVLARRGFLTYRNENDGIYSAQLAHREPPLQLQLQQVSGLELAHTQKHALVSLKKNPTVAPESNILQALRLSQMPDQTAATSPHSCIVSQELTTQVKSPFTDSVSSKVPNAMNHVSQHIGPDTRDERTVGHVPPVASATADTIDDSATTSACQNPFLFPSSIDQTNLLHHSCRLFPQDINIISSALKLDPDSIRRKCPVVCPRRRGTRLTFSLPLNIALVHDASLDVLRLLISSAPDLVGDVCDSTTPLLVALHQRREEVITFLLIANSDAVFQKDSRHNTPLHVACWEGCGLEVTRQLYELHPSALMQTNMHGETPLQVAQKSGHCKEEVTNFLGIQLDLVMEARCSHLV